jgi:hypothetical protein
LIKNCLIVGNAVDSWDCGGVFCWDGSPTITNCTFAHNRSNNFDGVGGALYCLGTSNPKVTNCIFSDNNDIAIYESEPESDPNVRWCLFYNNPDGDYYDRDSGAIYDANRSQPNNYLVTMRHYRVSDSTDSHNFTGNPMFVRGRLGDYYLSQFPAGQILDANGVAVDPNVNPADANSPAVDAGSGNANNPNIRMHLYSTRTDNVKDLGRVDIGYHYIDPCTPAYFDLTIRVIPTGSGVISFMDPNRNDITCPPIFIVRRYTQYTQVPLAAAPIDPCEYWFKSWQGTDDDTRIELDLSGGILRVQHNTVTMDANESVTATFETIWVYLRTRVIGGNGTVTPRQGTYRRGTVVKLTAVPANPSNRAIWYGSDNDFSTLLTNTVTMVAPFDIIDPRGREFHIVEVEFYAPRILNVPGDYTNLQQAIDDARDGDIVVIAPSDQPYLTVWGFVINGKAITITSANPDDPSVVARTVIEMQQPGPGGLVGPAFRIYSVNPDTVLNGLTIRGFNLYGGDGFDGNPDQGYWDGVPGGSVFGSAILCWVNASPTIKNCVITDCTARGGNGGNGADGDDGHRNGGHGGWPGSAGGAGIACLRDSNPIVINCTFNNCRAYGGNGGDGGNGDDDPWGYGGNGGGWYYSYEPYTPYEWGPFEFYTNYTGRGGAVYADKSSSPTFRNCTFTNNLSDGGTCGICGQNGPPGSRYEPSINWTIDNFGGAVYLGGSGYWNFGGYWNYFYDFNDFSKAGFINCTFSNNVADIDGTPNFEDEFVSYGGAVAFDVDSAPLFEGCTINNSLATIGGAMFWEWADPNIADCNFIQNTAYHGGGVYFAGGTSEILRSNFSENQAIIEAGEGGGIYCFEPNLVIADCNIGNNIANGSGGGMYIAGTSKTLEVKNCLITSNSAGRDGGGISANWYCEPNITNCTIAGNIVTGAGFETGYGGGLACTYNSFAKVVNSIIWGNLANPADFNSTGDQISVGTGFEFDSRPAVVAVSYSDVMGWRKPFDANAIDANSVFVDTGCTLIWDFKSNIDANPRFTNGYFLSQVAAGQKVNSPCVDAGSANVESLCLVGTYTTRTDLIPDSGIVDMGYHFGFPWTYWKGIQYELIVRVVGPGTVAVEPSAIDPNNKAYDPQNNVFTYKYDGGTLLVLTATPAVGYRVRSWSGTNKDPSWNRNTNVVILDGDKVVRVEFEKAITRNILVPAEYGTIEEAVAAAGYGDTNVIVSRGVHYVSDPGGIDFKGRSITLMSTDPNDPDIIATTIIDCRGDRYSPRRVFYFQSGEDPNTVVTGFTIRNAYTRGPMGLAGRYGVLTPIPYERIGPNPTDPPRAERGDSATGNGYGGAILCENASSPTIKNCVITNCTVTGAHGGDGALGQSTGAPFPDQWYYLPPGETQLQQTNNGQWGGHGGAGIGNGYGGAIACLGGSSPVIIKCTIKDNIARGGCGGDGGNGGSSASGQESWGGDGGDAIGDGIGGGIYCENESIPVIIDCNFTNNLASTGVPGPGGSLGSGSALDPRAQNGFSGFTVSRGGIAGGAAYYGSNSDANFVGCIFLGNSAYEFYPAIYTFYGLDVNLYTRGGALYSVVDNTVTLSNCTFTGNLGGAVFIEPRNIVDVNGCLFKDNEVHNRIDAYNYYNLFYLLYPGYGLINYETGGGAIYIGPDSNGVNIRNSGFRGNSAFYDGGAVSCLSDANFINCLFGGNETSRNGGAIEAFYDSNDPNVDTTLALKLESCIFAGNKATEGITGWGGAVHFQDFNATFTDCRFMNNTARNGGGLFLAGRSHSATVNMVGGVMHGNKAVGGSGINLNIGTSYAPYYYIGGPSSGWMWGGYGSYYYTPYEFDAFYNVYYSVGVGPDMSNSVDIGGGAVLADTHGRIENFTITDNVVEGHYGSGGAINFFGGYVNHVVKNCLITGNSSSVEGGAISANLFARPQIQNCDFNDNTAGELGGAIFCDWGSSPVVKDSIFRSCNSHAIAEEDFGYPQDPNVSIRYCLFYGNQDGDYGVYDSVTKNTSTRAGTELSVTNKAGDPLFAAGPLGDYYLRQSPPQTLPNSPALNAGSGLAGSLGMDKYTTRTDGVKDTGTVDIGYHYADHRSLVKYNLTVTVIGGQGSVEPASGTYYAGVPVTITAIPDKGWRVAKWTGTIDDDSTALTNVVIMGPDRTVTVEFGQPRHIVVGSDPNYTTIQHAIDAAADGDVVIIPTGTYTPAYPFPGLRINKGITLTSTNPDDPVCVRATVLSTYRLFITTVGSEAVIDGITIRDGGIDVYSCSPTIRNCIFTECRLRGGDGGNPTSIPDDGQNGVSLVGGAMIIYNGSPAVQNCAFIDCSVTGGDGGPGDDGAPGYDGGWAGWAYGGAAYIGFGSNPTFQDCSFTNCYARGGNGGPGGNATSPGTQGGRGGNWEWADSIETGPFTYPYWYWWDGWQYAPYDADGAPRMSLTGYGYYKDYWKYSGYGGAVYIEVDSSPKFINCTFRNNHTYGGVCGIGGVPTIGVWGRIPDRNLDIENFGGAIYACNNSNPEFISCRITDNSADTSTVPLPDDIMVSYGGGVAYEEDCSPKFENCNIANNAACIGGSIYLSNSTMTIVDSNIADSNAYLGGGLYSTHSTGTITGSIFAGNSAFVASSQEPNYGAGRMIGQGGGYYCLSSVVEITDSIFRANDANFSGGGIYFVGSDEDLVFSPLLHNCLLTANIAGRDGGGVSINWNAEPTISSCTIADNKVTSVDGYGGGLYCSYDSNAVVIDSIIWDNIAINGSQVAVGSGFEYEPRPSALRVIYTDIGPRYDPNAFTIPIITDLFANEPLPGGSGTVLVGAQEIYSQFDGGQERVKVIVSMPDPVELRAVTDWDSPVSAARYRGEVANRQLAVMSALTPGEFTLRYRYDNVAAFAGEITRAGLEKLLSNPLVAHIEPVRYVRPELAQAIPLANATDTRRVYDGKGVAIAIVDSGIDYRHPMLGGGGFPNSKVIGGYDTGNNDPDPMPVVQPHGTACAGIAAGNLGVVGDYIGGVAPGAKLYALKLTTDLDVWPTDSDLRAWDWCITHRNDDPKNPIKVMSNSWGMYGMPFNNPVAADAFSPAHTALADTAVAAGITIMAASGNDGYAGQGISWPSAMSKVISVGAVNDTTDQVMVYSDAAAILDILAPADPMYTTDIVGLGGYTPGDYFPYFNGTSSACPFAAGCVADIQTAAKVKIGRYLKPGEIKSLLIATGDAVVDWRVAITKPRVNLGRAVAIFLGLPGPPIYLEKGCELNGWEAPDTNNYRRWDASKWPNSHNIEEDPNFICGYYLSQIAAGQAVNSPAVNAGSALASVLGMNEYTTRVDGVNDVGVVDMGYHYSGAVHKYYVSVIIVEDPNYPGIHGTVEPSGGWYYEGTKATFKAKADRGYYLKGWYDVNDILLSGDDKFEIVVDSNEVFIVRFRLPNKIQVSGGGDAITRAVSTAENGDTLVVAAGTYDGGINLRGKHIQLVCTNPDDPNVVSMTIIDCQQAGRAFIFNTGEDADTVVDGFTIIDGNVISENGGGIYVDSNSSPTFVNVVISNCVANNGYGGGIFVNDGSRAAFINCTVVNCTADAGGGAFCDGNSAPIFDQCTFRGNFADFGGGMYFGINCMPDVNLCTFSGNAASQDGGGLFCGPDSTAAIADCNFAGNSAGRGAGVYCERMSETTVIGSIFTDNTAATDGGAVCWVDANMLIVDSNIVSNSAIRGGGLWCDASGETAIVGCTIGFNQAGPRLTEPNNPNDPNATTMGQGGGMYCFGTPVLLRDCIINHNAASTSGGGVYLSGDSNSPQIANCLIINNTSGRDGGGVSVNWYARPFISNCTFVGNATTGYFGVRGNTGLGGGLYCSYHSNSAVIDSIFWNNFGVKGFEIAVATGFEPDPRPAMLTVSYSDVKGSWPGVQVDKGCVLSWGAGNIDTDPLFAGGMFGGYYLSQTDVGDPNQTKNSPCVDAGSDYAGKLEMVKYTTPTGEMVGYTTRTDGELERGKVDMGYHYRTVEPCRFCDLVYDGIINFYDFAKLAANWLHQGCSDLNGWCQGGDLTYDRSVNLDDLAYFAECWLVADTEAPIPNPSEWEIEPYLTSSSSIKMIARIAFDAWGWDVAYYFDCVYGNCHDSSWQSSRTYQDTGLKSDAKYGYRVKARDEIGNETDWSVIRYAGVLDTTPPVPAPAWLVPPYPFGPSSIAMESTTAYDESGVSYGFWNVTRDPAGNNIVWQGSTQFIDVNLDPNTTYCYRVKARDNSANRNETGWSELACTIIPLPADITPPTPNPAQWDLTTDANGYNGRPLKISIGGIYYATMRAVQAVDPSGVEYKFVCSNDSRFSSQWQSQPAYPTPWTYTVALGGQYVYTEWYVIVRDQSPSRNQTAPSETWPALVRVPP